MAKPVTRDLVHMARQAGYQVVQAEQLRPNRWLLTLVDAVGRHMAVLVQARPLISAADALDLADIVRLRQLHSGILLAHEGSFSPAAQLTYQELADSRLRLCTALPLALKSEHLETTTSWRSDQEHLLDMIADRRLWTSPFIISFKITRNLRYCASGGVHQCHVLVLEYRT